MFINLHLTVTFLLSSLPLLASGYGFTYQGFSTSPTYLRTDGDASITQSGLLTLTTMQTHVIGHAFRDTPIPIRNSTTGSILSFSSTFVFAVVSKFPNLGGNGIAFVLAPTPDYTAATGSQYLGLVNRSNDGNSTNHLFFVELDSIYNPDIADINDNHVGIDINGVRSFNSTSAGYNSSKDSTFENLKLISGDPIQVWVDYDSGSMKLDVTLAPINMSKPAIPLLSSTVNLTNITDREVYVGFSSSTGSFYTSHYILGWSFQVNGKALPFHISDLPKLPEISHKTHVGRTIGISLASATVVFVAIGWIVYVVSRRIKFSELVEDWEAEYKSQRIPYRDLYEATGGFSEKRLLGVGGFGRVYKGVLPKTKVQVAVKLVAHESREGTKEFVSELASLGQLRHRNLVRLLGYCRRRRELMLVYEYMPNGSLDKALFADVAPALTWHQRVHVIRDVALGLYYLHEEWQKVVIHRDVKASNVLLDGDYNGKLGDFGLARLYDHGSGPRTTHLVGTMGYLAPELIRTGRATKATDVFAFGVFVLEVVCGRTPVEEGREVLVDWVVDTWRRSGGDVLGVLDPRMGRECDVAEAGRVVRLGVMCCHPVGSARPEIKKVVSVLRGDDAEKVMEENVGRKVLAAALHREMVEDKLASDVSPFVSSSVLWSGR